MSKVKRNQCPVCGVLPILCSSVCFPLLHLPVFVQSKCWYSVCSVYEVKNRHVPSHIRKGRCSGRVFGETYGVGDEREKRDILMSGFRYIVEGTQTVCDDGFLVRDIGGR